MEGTIKTTVSVEVNMYSPQMGQSHSVDRSIHRCEFSRAIDMHTLHLCTDQRKFENANNWTAPTLQWKKSFPSPCPILQIPQSLQWYMLLRGSSSQSLHCTLSACRYDPRQYSQGANLIAVVFSTPHAAKPAILLRRLWSPAMHAQHVFCLPPHQRVIFILVVTEPARMPPFARRAL